MMKSNFLSGRVEVFVLPNDNFHDICEFGVAQRLPGALFHWHPLEMLCRHTGSVGISVCHLGGEIEQRNFEFFFLPNN